MPEHRSRLVLYGALGANLAIAATKFVAAAITGSSAMLSEGIHSVVDSCNSLLLMLGSRLSQRPPDEMHPLGHSRELYVWALVVAVLIFAAGSGMTVYEGIMHLRHPEPLKSPVWNYAAIGAGFAFEGASWFLALRGLMSASGDRSVLEAFTSSKDPSVFAVLAEDSAALIGLLIALFGVLLNHLLGWEWADGVASILIGVLLAGVASFLVYQCRQLLIGESAGRTTIDAIERVARSDVDVVAVRRPLAIHLGPHDVVVNLILEFRDRLNANDIEAAVRRLESAVRSAAPDVKHVFISTQSISGRPGAG